MPCAASERVSTIDTTHGTQHIFALQKKKRIHRIHGKFYGTSIALFYVVHILFYAANNIYPRIFLIPSKSAWKRRAEKHPTIQALVAHRKKIYLIEPIHWMIRNHIVCECMGVCGI